ncbi:OLC1v1007461C1 [Oldenlandia corymbosa var. corymbosa]|uniref:OLC1v1007461C1 n=1 Tax=Oldenlandia corymbosa var. corymbosa TaxID=529605 RepID=A0AAV1DJA9_OLDCO|nr:OLC1v1007461C1 [Oldenlandia corymbosa var. corymbosa]
MALSISRIVNRINVALNDTVLRANRTPSLANDLKKQSIRLRNLKAFVVVSARKLNKDARGLESLLARIEDVVSRYAKKIHRPFDASTASISMPRLRIIFNEIPRLEEEIDDEGWFVAPADLAVEQQSSSSCLTADEILEITDSVLGNLVDFPMIFSTGGATLVSAMEALYTPMKFLRSFLLFAVEETCAENRHIKDLLTHFEAVAITAARVFINSPIDDELDERWCQRMQFNCSNLFPKIKPMDPQVCHTYTKALSSFRSSGRLRGQACRDFLDSLISILWDILQSDSGRPYFMKDPRQILYEGLRFLRTILKPEDVNEKIRDRIGALVCDAGVLIFSFFLKPAEINPALQELIRRINLVQSEAGETDCVVVPQTATIDLFTTCNMGVVDCFIARLRDLLLPDDAAAGQLYCTKDRRQVLTEGFRLFLTTLEQQPECVNGRIIRSGIEALISDASVLMCYFHQTHVDVNPDLQNLLVEIKLFLAKVEEKAEFNFHRTDEQGFDEILHVLGYLQQYEYLMELESDDVDALRVHLSRLEYFLKNTNKFLNDRVEVQALRGRIWKVAYRVEFLFNQFAVGDNSDFLSILCDSITKEVKGISNDVNKEEIKDITLVDLNKKEPGVERAIQTQVSIVTDDFVGFTNDFKSIVSQLKEERTYELDMVYICGVADPGKTTLASKVYNDPSVQEYFDVCAWCPVSPGKPIQKLFYELSLEISPGGPVGKHPSDFREVIKRHLKAKRYLIVLDDVWEEDTLTVLRDVLPPGFQSRILVTSRRNDIFPKCYPNKVPHSISRLTEEESLELLQRKLLHGKDWSPALRQLGMQIAGFCEGLPLTLVNVAVLLANSEQESWKEIVNGLCSGGIASLELSIKSWELSYKQLPCHLKPCLLYFGAFPTDEEVSVKRLIQLWIAEGLVRERAAMRIEDVAKEYLKELIGRSLVIVAKQGSTGGVKTCRISDSVHGFCLRKKAKEENFFHLLQDHEQLLNCNEPHHLKRLCIYDHGDGFKESKLFCPRASSLLFFPSRKESRYEQPWLPESSITPVFRRLKVLDLEQGCLDNEFPSGLEHLSQLRYMSIRGEIQIIPASIDKLSNLETFILHLRRGESKVSLPHTLWNLRKLKWLSIKSGGGTLPIETVEDSSVLFELESFSVAVIYSRDSIEKQLLKFPNIRRLKCDISRLFLENPKLGEIVIPGALEKLQSLHLLRSDVAMMNRGVFDFRLPEHLKKLTLSRLALPWEKISPIGKLPHLKVLKLLDSCFVGGKWNVGKGDFKGLEFLKLSRLDIDRWTSAADGDQFCKLEKLVLEHCSKLLELPDCLKNSFGLKVDVIYCADTLESEVNRIGELSLEHMIESSIWEVVGALCLICLGGLVFLFTFPLVFLYQLWRGRILWRWVYQR